MDNNRLIAEFMGITPMKVSEEIYTISKQPWISVCCISPEKCWEELGDSLDKKYRTSWDFLMPVVADIFELDYDFDANNLMGDLSCALLDVDIEAVYRMCVKIINVYNEKL